MITSTSNARVKEVAALCKKAREREKQDVFVVEGPKMFREVPEDHLIQTYVSDSFHQRYADTFLKGRKYEVVSDPVFAAMSDTKTPQGVICVVRQFHYTREDLMGKDGQTPLLIVLENLQDPGNLGTVLRTAEGAGVTGILMSRGTVDLYNPKVIRSTMGSIYRMPFVYTDDLHGDLKALREKGVGLYAAHLRGQHAYDEENYKEPTAFLIGNESKGLTDETADLADHYIRIPMAGQVESLNAAVASAILMYEAGRQRRNG